MRHEHVRWYSPHLERDMDALVFGHAGARVIVFPTSMGSFVEYRDRGMIDALSHHLEKGWIQIYCLDSDDAQSWYAQQAPPPERLRRHEQYERYVFAEVLPYSAASNPNPYVIFTGCSFGAFHAVLQGLRHPRQVNRVVGLSGSYDPARWLDGYSGTDAYFLSPIDFVGGVRDADQRQALDGVDIILAIGRDDPSYQTNVALSQCLAAKGFGHRLCTYDGWAHDWPYWREMILDHIGGAFTR